MNGLNTRPSISWTLNTSGKEIRFISHKTFSSVDIYFIKSYYTHALHFLIQDTYVYARELVRDIQFFSPSHFYYGNFVTWFTCGEFGHCPKSAYMGGELYILSRDAVEWMGNFNGTLPKIGHEDIVTGIYFRLIS